MPGSIGSSSQSGVTSELTSLLSKVVRVEPIAWHDEQQNPWDLLLKSILPTGPVQPSAVLDMYATKRWHELVPMQHLASGTDVELITWSGCVISTTSHLGDFTQSGRR
jgi:hypothetical protein